MMKNERVRIAKFNPHHERSSRPSSMETSKYPSWPRKEMLRRYFPASTTSTPGVARAAKNVQHSLPVIGRPEMEPEDVLIARLRVLLPSQMPELSWGPMIDLADTRVEAPHAAEADSQGDLAHG